MWELCSTHNPFPHASPMRGNFKWPRYLWAVCTVNMKGRQINALLQLLCVCSKFNPKNPHCFGTTLTFLRLSLLTALQPKPSLELNESKNELKESTWLWCIQEYACPFCQSERLLVFKKECNKWSIWVACGSDLNCVILSHRWNAC